MNMDVHDSRVSTQGLHQGLHPGSPPGSPPIERCLHLHSCACTRRNCPVTDARAHLRSSYSSVPSFLLQHLSFASAPRLCASPLCRSYCLPARLSFLFKPLRLAFVPRLRAWPLRALKLLPPTTLFILTHSFTLTLTVSRSSHSTQFKLLSQTILPSSYYDMKSSMTDLAMSNPIG